MLKNNFEEFKNLPNIRKIFSDNQVDLVLIQKEPVLFTTNSIESLKIVARILD